MPDLMEYVIDPQTGQTIRMPSAMAQYIGLRPPAPMANDPVYPPEAGGADPVQHDFPSYSNPSVADVVSQASANAARAGLPAGVRDGSYDTSDNASVTPPLPSVASRSGGSSMGPRGAGVLHLDQATGPMGTISQIGQPQPGAPMSPQGQYASNADLQGAMRDQSLTPPAPAQQQADPNKPEEAGSALSHQGIGMQEQATQANAAIDAQTGDAEAAALAKQQEHIAAIQKETADQAAAWDARHKEIQQNVKDKTDAWSTYKVDPGRRWRNSSTGQKLGAIIAVAMSALGDALQYKSGPNMALGMITKTIDDDVAQQVDERQNLGEIAAKSRTSLDDYRQEYGDWQSARAAKISEEYKRTADEIERQVASVKGDKARAMALSTIGDLRTRAGALDQGIAGSAFNREMQQAKAAEDKRQARVQEGLAYQRLNQDKSQFDRNFDQHKSEFDQNLQFERDKLAADQKSAADAYVAKATAEQAKNLQEAGIKDPTTGQYIMADGKPVLSRNAAEATDVQKTVDGTQTMLSTIDRIKAKIAGDPGFAKLNPTQKQAALSSEIDGLTLLLKDAYQTGTLDKGTFEFTNSYTGGDPTKLNSKALFSALGLGSDPGEKTAAKLDVVAQNAETRALNRMGNPKGFKFARDEKIEESPVNKAAADLLKGTPTNAAAIDDAQPGALSKVNPFSGAAYDETKANIENSGSLKYPGLAPDKQEAMDALIAGAQSADKKTQDQAQKRLIEMVADTKTKGLSDAAMTAIQVNAPQMYGKALAALPDDKRALRIAADVAAQKFHTITLHPNGGVTPPQPQTPQADYQRFSPSAALDYARRYGVPGDE